MTFWLVIREFGGGGVSRFDLDREESPTIMARGLGGVWISQHRLEDDGIRVMQKTDTKPPFHIPTMREIEALRPNGFKVASTFSGCGGSCTGYRMAGFAVAWANEFVPIAQASYKANAAPTCVLDPRDIKLVQSEEILSAAGLRQGELDVFDGSPPCQAFSTAGKREKGWGTERHYEHGATQTNETLFDEYIRLLRGLQPRTFVAENVTGLVKGKAKGFFLEILAALKASGYRVACRVIDAKWLGVPQTRKRTIFIGVRNDLDLEPPFPEPLPYFYTVRDALPHLLSAEHGTTEQHPNFVQGEFVDRTSPTILAGEPTKYKVRATFSQGGFWKKDIGDLSSPCVTATQSRLSLEGGDGPRRFTIDEVKTICGFPSDFVLVGSYAQQWERLGNSVPPVMMAPIARKLRDRVLLVASSKTRKGRTRGRAIPGA